MHRVPQLVTCQVLGRGISCLQTSFALSVSHISCCNMTVEKSLVRIEAMLCELLQLARDDDGESTFSAGPGLTSKTTRSKSISSRNGPASEEDTRSSFGDEPNTTMKRARSASGSSHEQTDSTGTSEGIDENSECIKCMQLGM